MLGDLTPGAPDTRSPVPVTRVVTAGSLGYSIGGASAAPRPLWRTGGTPRGTFVLHEFDPMLLQPELAQLTPLGRGVV